MDGLRRLDTEFATGSSRLTTLWVPALTLLLGIVVLALALLGELAPVPWWVPTALLAVTPVAAPLTRATARVVRDPIGSVLRLQFRRRLRRMRSVSLSSLVSVELAEAPFGLGRRLELRDGEGGALALPLDIWSSQEQLLAAIAVAVRGCGVNPGPRVVGLLAAAERAAEEERYVELLRERVENGEELDDFDVERAVRWLSRPAPARARRSRLALGAFLLGFAAIAVGVGVAHPDSGGDVDPADVERVAAGVENPFVGAGVADVYLVPLDTGAVRDAQAVVGRLERTLELNVEGLHVMRISVDVLDRSRRQLRLSPLIDALGRSYHSVHGRTSATIVGITSLDSYLEAAAEDKFAFAGHISDGLPGVFVRAFGVVSTARMDGAPCGRGVGGVLRALWEDVVPGGDESRWRHERIRKMVMRIVALRYYRLPRTSSGHAITRSPIRSLCDLDRLEERFGVAAEKLRGKR